MRFMGEGALSSENAKLIERFVNLLYINKKKEYRDRFDGCTDIGSLRWVLHSRYSEESSCLPPTPAALKFHIQRSNYVCHSWRRLLRDTNPELPSTTDYGWSEDHKPVLTDELPAPEFSLMLNICASKKPRLH